MNSHSLSEPAFETGVSTVPPLGVMVPVGRLELPILAALASKASVYAFHHTGIIGIDSWD